MTVRALLEELASLVGADIKPLLAAGPASHWYVGSNAYDAELLAKVKAGDLFLYDASGSVPGEFYQWADTGDGTLNWVDKGNLRGPAGTNGQTIVISSTPPADQTVLWVDTSGA